MLAPDISSGLLAPPLQVHWAFSKIGFGCSTMEDAKHLERARPPLTLCHLFFLWTSKQVLIEPMSYMFLNCFLLIFRGTCFHHGETEHSLLSFHFITSRYRLHYERERETERERSWRRERERERHLRCIEEKLTSRGPGGVCDPNTLSSCIFLYPSFVTPLSVDRHSFLYVLTGHVVLCGIYIFRARFAWWVLRALFLFGICLIKFLHAAYPSVYVPFSLVKVHEYKVREHVCFEA